MFIGHFSVNLFTPTWTRCIQSETPITKNENVYWQVVKLPVNFHNLKYILLQLKTKQFTCIFSSSARDFHAELSFRMLQFTRYIFKRNICTWDRNTFYSAFWFLRPTSNSGLYLRYFSEIRMKRKGYSTFRIRFKYDSKYGQMPKI